MRNRILIGVAVGLLVYAALPKEQPAKRRIGGYYPPPLVPPSPPPVERLT